MSLMCITQELKGSHPLAPEGVWVRGAVYVRACTIALQQGYRGTGYRFLRNVEYSMVGKVFKREGGLSYFSPSLPRRHILFLVSCPVPLKLVRDTPALFLPLPPNSLPPG